jgi:hypothetical protein
VKGNIQVRLAKLEAAAPKEHSPIESMTRDELIAFILTECSALLASDNLPEDNRAYVEQALFDTLCSRDGRLTKAGLQPASAGGFPGGVNI